MPQLERGSPHNSRKESVFHNQGLMRSKINTKKKRKKGRGGFSGSPVVKTLPSNAGNLGLIPGRGTKIPHASWPRKQNIKQKQFCNKFNKDFKMVQINSFYWKPRDALKKKKKKN